MSASNGILAYRVEKIIKFKNMKKEDSIKFGKKGAEIRWSNYRKHLIDELSKLCDKQELNYYLAFSNSALQEALLIKRGQKKHG